MRLRVFSDGRSTGQWVPSTVISPPSGPHTGDGGIDGVIRVPSTKTLPPSGPHTGDGGIDGVIRVPCTKTLPPSGPHKFLLIILISYSR